MSREQTALHREQILNTAARLFREHGLHGIGVADLMGEAGLTHGGFYGHFQSKQALSAQACERTFEQTLDYWSKFANGESRTSQSSAARFISSYLSPQHRAQPGVGCAAPALAADVAREASDSPVRKAFTRGVQGMADLIGAMLPGKASARRRERSLMILAALVGAVTLARATQGDAISDEILAAVDAGARQLSEI
jgi:TetR/AcrR family transcriptional repressor of nem operon